MAATFVTPVGGLGARTWDAVTLVPEGLLAGV